MPQQVRPARTPPNRPVQRGMSLDQALDEVRLLPAEQRLAVRMGLATGQLPSALQEAAHGPSERGADASGPSSCTVCICGGPGDDGGISLFIAIKLLSGFQKIFHEFELEQGMADFVSS